MARILLYELFVKSSSVRCIISSHIIYLTDNLYHIEMWMSWYHCHGYEFCDVYMKWPTLGDTFNNGWDYQQSDFVFPMWSFSLCSIIDMMLIDSVLRVCYCCYQQSFTVYSCHCAFCEGLYFHQKLLSMSLLT